MEGWRVALRSVFFFFFFKQKTAYEIGWCDWSSDVCSSDLPAENHAGPGWGGRNQGLHGNRPRGRPRRRVRQRQVARHSREGDTRLATKAGLMPSMRPQIKQVSVLGHGGFRKLSYAEWGSPKAARTVVCVHGVSR